MRAPLPTLAVHAALIAALVAGCASDRARGAQQSDGGGAGDGGKPGDGGGGGAGGGGDGEEGEGEGGGDAGGGGEGEGEAEGEGEGQAEGEGEGGEGEGDVLPCEPGVPFCASENMRHQWDPECVFTFELPCDQGLVCHPPTAECVPPVCNRNNSHCKDQRTREFCNDTGSAWLPPSPCAETLICVESDALNAACSPVVCQPGTLDCHDDRTVKVCNDNGTDWVREPCDEGQSCDDDDHTCKDRVCDPDSSRCDDRDPQVAWVCDSLGISEERLDCAADKVCLDGRCEFPQ